MENERKKVDVIKAVVKMLADEGEKSAKAISLKFEFDEVMAEIVEKYCLKTKEDEEKIGKISNFLKQIVSLAKDLQIELDK